MSNVVALFPAGVRAALLVALVDATTPNKLRLALEAVALVLLLVLVD